MVWLGDVGVLFSWSPLWVHKSQVFAGIGRVACSVSDDEFASLLCCGWSG